MRNLLVVVRRQTMAVRKSMLQHQRDIAAAFRGALRCSAWLRTAPREFVVQVKSQLTVV